MNKPRKKIHIVGERRPELDVARFADALIGWAMHRLSSMAATTDQAHDQGAALEEKGAP